MLSNTKIYRMENDRQLEEVDPATNPIAAKILEAVSKLDRIEVKCKPSELRKMAEANRRKDSNGGE